ncbi:MAG: 3-deoxy-D-manno-octulosonic acid transferase [Bacteroidetes bacterium]|nr:3-deoxy-D-manno-octulosonic acid transferase [Bacteroidota bacterium]
MIVIYNLVVRLYGFIIRCASVKNTKAKAWVSGRKNWENKLKEQKLSKPNTIWFHCASYGEFEQGLPLIQAVKENYKNYNIVITFFSPSGYTVFNNSPLADAVYYLPLDTSVNAKKFIQLLNPNIAVFIKYEFWLNYLFELKNKQIKTYLVSATFKPHHPFFKWYGKLFVKSLHTFKTIYLQDLQSQKLLNAIQIKNTIIAGDTRFDRVTQIKNQNKDNQLISQFKNNSLLFIAGSTWPDDDDYIINSILKTKNLNFKYIIAPHEISESNIIKLEEKLKLNKINYCTYSNFNENNSLLILNCMGQLSSIYKYADLTYIGGGFGKDGIHNILESTVYLKPSSFYGNNYSKFNEIVELKALNCIINLNENNSLIDLLNNYNNLNLNEIQLKLEGYFSQRVGSTQKVLLDIFGN